MVQLNLPSFECRLKKAEGKLWIFDVIRKKWVVLQPEEWVRQHFVHYLLARKYPRALIRVESGLSYNQILKRSDIVIFARTGDPWMIIECKAPDVPVSEKTLFQVSTYNATLKAPYLAVSNGMTHLFARIHWNTSTTEWLAELPDFPE